MSDLRIAAQQALEFIKVTNARSEFWLVPGSNLNKTVNALRAALEQPEQEVKGCDHCNHPLYAAIKCHACGRVTEQEEQEPVAWMVYTQDGKSVCVTDNPADFIEWRSFPLYTHPPRREWRSLSEEEIESLWRKWVGTQRPNYSFTRAIEAALKERNV